MNSKQNNHPQADLESAPLSAEQLTAHALGESSGAASRQIQNVALDNIQNESTKRTVTETILLGSLIKQSVAEELPTEIMGLAEDIDEAFRVSDQAVDAKQSTPAKQRSADNASRFGGARAYALAVVLLLMIGVGAWMLPDIKSSLSRWKTSPSVAERNQQSGPDVAAGSAYRYQKQIVPESNEKMLAESTVTNQGNEDLGVRLVAPTDKSQMTLRANVQSLKTEFPRSEAHPQLGRSKTSTVGSSGQVLAQPWNESPLIRGRSIDGKSTGGQVNLEHGVHDGRTFGEELRPLREHSDTERIEFAIIQSDHRGLTQLPSLQEDFELLTRFERLGDIGRLHPPYQRPLENDFVPVAGENTLSTFSIDVDTASYASVRRSINSKTLPPPASVRVEEFINYFDYDYPQPDTQDPFSVNMEVASCPWNNHHVLLRVGIQGQKIDRGERPASNLVFLIDVSGSMSSDAKLPLLKRTLAMFVDQLTENDRISIVTYAGQAGTCLQPTTGDQKQKIQQVIEQLSSGGSTHGSAGIEMAYDLAKQHFIPEGTNRVILATDGDLNVGVTSDDALVRLIKNRAADGTFLSVLGFGTGNYRDSKLEKLADNGNGNYHYIDTIREGHKVLVEEMSATLLTIAKDVKLQLEFNPVEVRSYRLIGYENRAIANQDFSNDRIDAGDIGAGHSVTAFYELVPRSAPDSELIAQQSLRYQQPTPSPVATATPVEPEFTPAAFSGELLMLSLRFKQPDASSSELREFPLRNHEHSFQEASADFRFAAAVASFAMILRQSQYSGSWDLDAVEATAAQTTGHDPQGYRAELIDLVRQVKAMTSR